MKDNYAKCEQHLDDCACNSKGRCLALSDTHFDYICPFYKPREQERRNKNDAE